MSDPMQEIRASFFVECEELLEVLQDGLEALAEGDSTDETVNTVFRAVHSIKGGAGAFSLTQLVDFAHKFENALDDVRAGRLSIDADVMRLFFRSGDILSDVVKAARDDADLPDAVVGPVIGALVEIVGGPGTDAEAEVEEVEFTPTALSIDLGAVEGMALADNADAGRAAPTGSTEPSAPDEAAPNSDAGFFPKDASEPASAVTDATCYRIHFMPEPELFNSGNEPLYILRALADLGQMTSEVVVTSAFPALDELSATIPLVGWRIDLETTAGQQAVSDIFEFVDGLCQLRIERLFEKSVLSPTPPLIPEPPPPVIVTDDPTAASSDRPADTGSLSPNVGRMDAATKRPVPASSGMVVEPGSSSKSPRGAEADAARSPSAPTPKSATVRVDLERIDRLVNLVGELVINQAMLAQSVAEAGLPTNTAVTTGLDEFQQLTRSIQESVMMIRAQPVKSLFQRMARIVREASHAVEKDVRLVTEGESTEIDKTVIERLADPLTHMIRNAVDHGLEAKDQRLAAGKPERGTVTLTAAHRSGRVVIEVSDDGGGIDRAKVQAIAEGKGLIPKGQLLHDSEIDNLLFLPGFSTASQISNISGRGVGMDVVKNSISALGGRISIHSTPGAGTTFSISLPLTLAVLDGMVVQVEDETMVVPLNSIAETLTLGDGDARKLGSQTRIVRVREAFVPLLDLAAELGYRPPRSDYHDAIALLIVQEDGCRAALVVDAIVDQRQVVIKGLQDSYGHVPGVAAATILGDGQIALILDPADLIRSSGGPVLSDQELMEAS